VRPILALLAFVIVRVAFFPTQIGGVPVTLVETREGCSRDDFAVIGRVDFRVGAEVRFLEGGRVEVDGVVYETLGVI
jgi:hypothetical protein